MSQLVVALALVLLILAIGAAIALLLGQYLH